MGAKAPMTDFAIRTSYYRDRTNKNPAHACEPEFCPVLCRLRILLCRPFPTKVEASELDDRLCHLDFDSVHFLGISGDCESSVCHHLTPLGYGFKHSFAQPVPSINVDPQSFVFVRTRREFLYCDREFDDLVACVSEGNCVGSLTDVSNYCDLIIHDFWHLQCVLVRSETAQASAA